MIVVYKLYMRYTDTGNYGGVVDLRGYDPAAESRCRYIILLLSRTIIPFRIIFTARTCCDLIPTVFFSRLLLSFQTQHNARGRSHPRDETNISFLKKRKKNLNYHYYYLDPERFY